MKTKTLELDDDPKFQRKLEWGQKLGSLVLLAFVAATALGYFGQSELAFKKQNDGHLSIEYSRFLRQQTENEHRIFISGPFTSLNRASFWMPLEYLKQIDVQRIQPVPEHTVIDGNGVRFEFAVTDRQEDLQVLMRFKPQVAGRLHGSVRHDKSSANLAFEQFAYF